MTVAQAASLLNVSEKTIRRWVTDSKIPYVKLPSCGVRIPPGALLASLEGTHDLAAEIAAPKSHPRKLLVLLAYGALTYRAEHLRLDLEELTALAATEGNEVAPAPNATYNRVAMSTKDDSREPSNIPAPPPDDTAIHLDRKGMVMMPHEPATPIEIEDMAGGLPPATSQETTQESASASPPSDSDG